MKIQLPDITKFVNSSWGQALREVIRTPFFWMFLAIVLGFGLVIQILADTYDAGFTLSSVLYSRPLHGALIIFSFLFFSLRLLYITIVIRPQRPLSTFISEFRTLWFTPRRIVTGLSVMIFIPLFFSFFTSAKNLIPFIHPFSWDPVFAEWERMIHFGRQPWEWLHPFLKAAIVTSTISFVYKLWFFSKYMVIFWQAFSLKRPNLRSQFFITMLLSWILNGFVLALIFSSAGPCYFGHFYPDIPNPYAGLMEFLRGSDKISQVFDLWAMDYLINAYNNKTTNLFSGISAFPSMHVSVAFMNVLLGWRINRKLGIFFTVYLLLIMIGSVHIGWHYAIDGYMSIVTTFILWKIVGLFFPKDKMTNV